MPTATIPGRRPLGEGVYYSPRDYAGFCRRMLIECVDLIVAALASSVVLAAFSAVFPDIPDGGELLILGFVFSAYFVLVKWRISTVGYAVARSRLVNLRGEAPALLAHIGRFLFSVLGPINIVLDFIWITSDEQRQALRDKFFHTYVVRSHAKPLGRGHIVYRTYYLMGASFIFREVQPLPSDRGPLEKSVSSFAPAGDGATIKRRGYSAALKVALPIFLLVSAVLFVELRTSEVEENHVVGQLDSTVLELAFLDREAHDQIEKGDLAAAERLAKLALKGAEARFGRDGHDCDYFRLKLARLYEKIGDYQSVLVTFQSHLEIVTGRDGRASASAARVLNALGVVYEHNGEYEQAETHYQRALTTYEQAADYLGIASVLQDLAVLYHSTVHDDRIGLICSRAIATGQIIWAEDSGVLETKGDHERAARVYAGLLPNCEPALATDQVAVAGLLEGLGTIHRLQGDYHRSEPYYQRALHIRESLLDREHTAVADVTENLAHLHYAKGNYDSAQSLYQQALALRESALGPADPKVAVVLSLLGNLYRDMGDEHGAEFLYDRALEIWEKQSGPEGREVAILMNRLGQLYLGRGELVRAIEKFERALQIADSLEEQPRRPRHTMTGPLQIFGNEVHEEKDTAPVSYPTISILWGLGVAYSSAGDTQKAEAVLSRAADLIEEAESWANPPGFGFIDEEEPAIIHEIDPHWADALNQLALLYWKTNRFTEAVRVQAETSIREDSLTPWVTISRSPSLAGEGILSPHQLEYEADFSISLHHTAELVQNAEAARMALSAILSRKGRVLDAMSRGIRDARHGAKGVRHDLLKDWVSVATDISNLAWRESAIGSQTAESVLDRRLDELEVHVAGRGVKVQAEVDEEEDVGFYSVCHRIPENAALIEIARYRPFDPISRTRGAPHYIAYVMRNTGQRGDAATKCGIYGSPKSVDLGDAETIDEAAKRFREALNKASQARSRVALWKDDLTEAGQTLSEKVIWPILRLIEPDDVQLLLISPDGNLNLVPFGALRHRGSYLAERFTIAYLSSGRDLLRLKGRPPSREPPLILAAPDFGEADSELRVATATNGLRSVDFSLRFDPLPSAALESAAVWTLFPDAQVRVGHDAMEGAVKAAKGPSILHLVTHGFFLQDFPEQEVKFDPKRGTWVQPSANRKEHPLLRSGVALQGANLRSSENEDGVLTALEVCGLDLEGTQLVVLSACETGLGDVQNGEGVLGLRRAFAMAGAETVVMSLWKVSDQATRDLMIAYYQRLKAGDGRAEALRQAQLEMLKRPEYNHPYYWASFISSGAWTPLHE